MHRTDAPGNVAGAFVEQDAQLGVDPTEMGADWANAVQEEIATFIESEGIGLNKADNTQLAQAIKSASGSARRNALLNGSFNLIQRFGSGGLALAHPQEVYVFDRWLFDMNTPGSSENPVVTQIDFDPKQTDVAGNPLHYCRVLKTIGAVPGGVFEVRQRIENVGTFHGQTVVFGLDSEEVDNPGIDLDVYVLQHFGTGGSADVKTLVGTITVPGAWTRQFVTVTVPSIAGKSVSATVPIDHYLELILEPTKGGTYDLHLANAQLELGSSPSSFAEGSPDQELALCQRYYEDSFAAAVSAETVGAAGDAYVLHDTAVDSEVIGFGALRFNVEKRAVPVVTWRDSQGGAPTADQIVYNGASSIVVTSVGASVVRPGRPDLTVPPAAGLVIARAHWSAEAEL